MESCSDDVIDWLQRGVWSALGVSAIMLSFQVITQVFDTEVKGQSILSTKGEKARGAKLNTFIEWTHYCTIILLFTIHIHVGVLCYFARCP